MDAVSTDASSFSVRETPRRRPAGETVADFTMMVRVPGKPATFRAFTEPGRHSDRAAAAATSVCRRNTYLTPVLSSPHADGTGSAAAGTPRDPRS